MSAQRDWLFTGEWTWRVGAAALDPRRWRRQYRALRRRARWPRRRAARFVAWCCWRELTGWARP